MRPHEAAYLNHLRCVMPIAFKDYCSSSVRHEDNVLAEHRHDGLADWIAAARWGAEHQDVAPEELLKIEEPRKNPWYEQQWTKQIPTKNGWLTENDYL